MVATAKSHYAQNLCCTVRQRSMAESKHGIVYYTTVRRTMCDRKQSSSTTNNVKHCKINTSFAVITLAQLHTFTPGSCPEQPQSHFQVTSG